MHGLLTRELPPPHKSSTVVPQIFDHLRDSKNAIFDKGNSCMDVELLIEQTCFLAFPLLFSNLSLPFYVVV